MCGTEGTRCCWPWGVFRRKGRLRWWWLAGRSLWERGWRGVRAPSPPDGGAVGTCVVARATPRLAAPMSARAATAPCDISVTSPVCTASGRHACEHTAACMPLFAPPPCGFHVFLLMFRTPVVGCFWGNEECTELHIVSQDSKITTYAMAQAASLKNVALALLCIALLCCSLLNQATD